MHKKIALAVVALAGLILPLFALDVDESEVSSTSAKPIEFVNYEGPHAVIETAESIRGIGRNLGSAVAKSATRAGESGRYLVIHAVDPAVKAGLDADILMLGEGARVDHVRNLRRIVAGFLETAYGYSAKDADTLAIFITIYNAVYRGDMGYFASKYKTVVTRELTAATAGLSIRWDEWAGRSRIVIPLTSRAGAGVIGSIDTSQITDTPTVASLKDESPTKGVEERIDVVDIKERSQEEEKAAIEAERARIAKEEAAIAAEKARIEAGSGTAAATDTTTTPGDAATDGAANTTGTAGADAAGTDAAADRGDGQEASITVTDKAREEEAAVAAREAQVEADKAALAEREAATAAKDTEIAADRAAISDDQKDVIRDEIATAAQKEAAGVVLFELVDPDLPLSRIALVDLKTGETIRKSALNTIRAATIIDVGDAFVAIAGQATTSGGLVRLVRVAKTDYADVVQGNDDVFADGMLWKFGSSVYTIVKKSDGWSIGRFDPATLAIKASSAPVSRWTFLTQSGSSLVAQGPGGSFLVLDAETLATASEIK